MMPRYIEMLCKLFVDWAVVVAQLVERLLPIPEVRGSNPVISKIYIEHFTVNCIEKTKIKKKRPGKAHFLRKLFIDGQTNYLDF